MIKQELQIKQQQRLSPLQIQLMRLLQVPTMNLEQRIKQEIEENPALEEAPDTENISDQETGQEVESEGESRDTEEFDMRDYYDEDDVATYKLRSNNHPDYSEQREFQWVAEGSFYDSLKQQFSLLENTEEEAQVGFYIIGNLDEDGYLRRDIHALINDLVFTHNIELTPQKLENILKKIQTLDPAGVGARDLQECLLLQLERKDDEAPAIHHAMMIVKKMFDAFSKKQFAKIINRFGYTEIELRDAIAEIVKLNPKPGVAYETNSKSVSPHIIPDFYLTNEDGILELSLNAKNSPELRISKEYVQLLKDVSGKKQHYKEQKEVLSFIKQKIESANNFMLAIRQRQDTLLKTMQAIIEMQYEYFQDGDKDKLKPMLLKDVAEATGFDISTISRVVNNKYIQTHFGLFLLREFFGQSITTEEGEDMSVLKIKQAMEEIVRLENKNKPLTDMQLKEELGKKGFQISRRTVTKYRESLNIPVGRLRKEL